MKAQILDLLQQAVDRLHQQGVIAQLPSQWHLEPSRQAQHGDFATNMALVLAKQAKLAPRQLAQQLIDAIPDNPLVEKMEIAGPGFINFFVQRAAMSQVIGDILAAQKKYGYSTQGQGQKVQVELVSANPTGPLHVGHGRGAALGDSIANLLETTGYQVTREYYVNDAGRQMHILAVSVWLRYLSLAGQPVSLPARAYQGDYVVKIAKELHQQEQDHYRRDFTQPKLTGEDEKDIDRWIACCRDALGENYHNLFQHALQAVLNDIHDDLSQFGVVIQKWYSERSLVDRGAIDQAVATLQDNGHLYTKDGALWFRSTEFGDRKDRVVQRENGEKTYFASDIAYHSEKFTRFDRVVDVWGADHHGYIDRVKGALQAMGHNPDHLQVKLVQFAALVRQGERISMSTRSGDFVTLRDLYQEVGRDAARFFYAMHRSEQHMDFDLDLARERSNDNPVYYVQYAHARICQLMRQAQQKDQPWQPEQADLAQLTTENEQRLLALLGRYGDMLASAARQREPHQVVHYLRELAAQFHSYYNQSHIVVEQTPLRNARLSLCAAIRQLLANGLNLLGVNAPETM